MIKISCAMLVALSCMTSCATVKPVKPAVEIGATAKEAMAIARKKAKAGEYDYIMDHMLSKELVGDMIRKHGAEKWRAAFKKERLERLPYYFGWLKNGTVKTSGEKVFLSGQHGCYAEYVKVGSVYLIVDFGQRFTSM